MAPKRVAEPLVEPVLVKLPVKARRFSAGLEEQDKRIRSLDALWMHRWAQFAARGPRDD